MDMDWNIELPLCVPQQDHQAQNTPYSTVSGAPAATAHPPFAQSAIAAMSATRTFPIYFLLFWIERLW
jgi:hypothetical protein